MRRLNKKNYLTYFISDGEFVKIGKSNNPKQRLAILQCGNSKTLTILKVLPMDIEKELHEKFSEDAIQHEWFHFSDAIREYLTSIS